MLHYVTHCKNAEGCAKFPSHHLGYHLAAPNPCFVIPIRCSVSKPERFKGVWVRKYRLTFGLFDTNKFRERFAKCLSIFVPDLGPNHWYTFRSSSRWNDWLLDHSVWRILQEKVVWVWEITGRTSEMFIGKHWPSRLSSSDLIGSFSLLRGRIRAHRHMDKRRWNNTCFATVAGAQVTTLSRALRAVCHPFHY